MEREGILVTRSKVNYHISTITMSIVFIWLAYHGHSLLKVALHSMNPEYPSYILASIGLGFFPGLLFLLVPFVYAIRQFYTGMNELNSPSPAGPAATAKTKIVSGLVVGMVCAYLLNDLWQLHPIPV